MADNLTNLGVVDTSTAANQPLAASTGEDLVSQVMAQESQVADLRQRKPSSLLGELGTKKGALAALLAGGAFAAGQPGLGAGIVRGAVGQAGATAAQENVGAEEQVTMLQDQLEKMRTRLVQVYQTDPQALMTMSGDDAIEPTVLGHIMLGLDLPISPAAAAHNRQRAKEDDTRIDFWAETYKLADTPEKAAIAAKSLNASLNLGLSDAELEDMSDRDELGMMSSLLSNNNLSTQSVLDAALYAANNGTSFTDPNALKLLAPAVMAKGGSASDEKWNTLQGLRAELTAYVAAHPEAMTLPQAEQAALAFEDDPGSLALLNAEYITTRLKSPITNEVALAIANNVGAKLANLSNFIGKDKMSELLGGRTVEEVIRDDIEEAVGALETMANNNQQRTFGGQRARVRSSIATEFPSSDPTGLTKLVDFEYKRIVESTGAKWGDTTTYDYDAISIAVDNYVPPSRKTDTEGTE